ERALQAESVRLDWAVVGRQHAQLHAAALGHDDLDVFVGQRQWDLNVGIRIRRSRQSVGAMAQRREGVFAFVIAVGGFRLRSLVAVTDRDDLGAGDALTVLVD